MSNSKVSGEFEKALQEVQDLRLSMFGMENELKRVERLLTSSGNDVAPKYVASFAPSSGFS
jgi:hypothetical protein